MKKIKFFLGFALGLMFCIIPNVNAEATFSLSETQKELYAKSSPTHLTYNDSSYSCSGYEECYQEALKLFDSSGKQYYVVRLDIDPSDYSAYMYLQTFNFGTNDIYTTTVLLSPQRLYFTINDVNYTVINATTSSGGIKRVTYELYDTNFNFISSSNYSFSNFYSTDDADNIIVNANAKFPVFRDLINYNSYAEYIENDVYTTVDLDNYEYVILNLKNYSKKEAFETNLQVKGSVAITPVYEFGTVEKETITDVCNTSYSDFTDYRFFVLKNDLINNAVYIVKNCQEDSSSFRFDSTVFDITYVTAENVNDPVITFGGVEYHTIPFNKLSNTVNKNEEEGFIPGTSEQFDPFGSIVDYIKSFWNSLSTFMGLVTKFFNTLPIEIRAIAITTFTTACTLGLLKIIKS